MRRGSLSRAALVGTVLLAIGLLPGAALAAPLGPLVRSAPALHLGPAANVHATSTTAVSSTNWAGYAVPTTNGAVTDVQGSWVIPKFHGSCGGLANFSAAAIWVGIDGYSSSTVEQTGTMIECTSLLGVGAISYYAWYEFYPSAPVTFSMTVSPGDHVSAQVQYSSSIGGFVATLDDTTTGVTDSASSGALTANQSSAEWIAEAPYSSLLGILPLVDFGSVHFTGCQATIHGKTHGPGGFPNSAITMWNNAGTQVKASPGALKSKGTAFTVTWKSYGP